MSSFTLHPVFQSGMVLQRHKPIKIWGQAPSGASVTVHLLISAKGADSPDGEGLQFCKTDYASVDGRWQCVLPPQEAAENAVLEISCSAAGAEPVILSPVLIGEVWLAGGQSNMEFFLRYDADWEKARHWQPNPLIRMYNVPQLAFPGHQKDTRGYGCWFGEGEEGFETFSAPGYSFARNIQPILHVPIGIIGCNWGGTSASTWLDETFLKDGPLSVYLEEYEAALSLETPEALAQRSLSAWAFEDSQKHISDFMPLLYGRDRDWQLAYMKEHKDDPLIPMGPYHINRPGGLYHQMLKPLAPFSLRGVLWYQGESDAYHAEIYDKLLSAVIRCLRRDFEDELPFLMVQLAPFGVWLDCNSLRYSEVRQKQELVSRTVSLTGMVSIMDIGSYYDIHPKQKLEVGRRLALLARGMVYGEDILCQSPALAGAERKADTIVLSFSHAEGLHSIPPYSILPDSMSPCGATPYGMTLPILESGQPEPVFVLQQDGKTVPIEEILIQGAQIILRVPALSPASCRLSFAHTDYAEVRIWNRAGLPVLPFVCELEAAADNNS